MDHAGVPCVSVVIPAYRAAAYIRDALESVVAQAGPDVEIIVVNDGSPDTDALERALQPYRERIIYLKQPNGGVSSARNTGILAARGEWVAFLDADDVWMPGYLEVQRAFLRASPSLDMVFPNCMLFGETALAGRCTMDLSPFEGEITFLKALAGECTIAYCALVRREILLRAGLFDTALRGSEDFNLWLRILKLGGRIGYHRTPLYKYRRHDASLTSDAVWMAERILESLERSEETIPMSAEEHAAAEKHRSKIRREIALMRGKAAFQAKRWEAALEYYRQANRFAASRKLQLVLILLRFCPGVLYNVFQGRQKAALALSNI
jgi:glycosyltransferase involved in cell wall biosynthesis